MAEVNHRTARRILDRSESDGRRLASIARKESEKAFEDNMRFETQRASETIEVLS